jgi:hypothetical protein
MAPPPKKKVGPPPGNRNALKHGLYAARSARSQLRDLEQDLSGSLRDEMDLLLVVVSDVAASVLDRPPSALPFDDHLSALRALSVAVSRFVNLLHTRLLVLGDPDRRRQQFESVFALLEDMQRRRGSKAFSAPAASSASLASPSPVAGKHPGPPPGNLNALRHGCYSRSFTPAELKLLRQADREHLRRQESLLRLLILRAWASMRSAGDLDKTYAQVLSGMRTIAAAVFVIEKIQRLRRRLFDDRSPAEQDLLAGLELARDSLGLRDFLSPEEKK